MLYTGTVQAPARLVYCAAPPRLAPLTKLRQSKHGDLFILYYLPARHELSRPKTMKTKPECLESQGILPATIEAWNPAVRGREKVPCEAMSPESMKMGAFSIGFLQGSSRASLWAPATKRQRCWKGGLACAALLMA